MVSTCERDDETIKPQTHNTTQGSAVDVKTVSFETAISHFNSKQNHILSQRSKQRPSAAYGAIVNPPIEITPDWSTLEHIPYYDIDHAQLTLSDVAINRDGDYTSKLFFMNIDDNIESVIFTIVEDEVSSEGQIMEGSLYYNKLDGTFIDGFKIEDGKLSKRYILQDEPMTNQAGFLMLLLQAKEDCGWYACSGGGSLGTVDLGIIPSNSGNNSWTSTIWWTTDWAWSSRSSKGNGFGWGRGHIKGGGGGTNSKAASLYTKASKEKKVSSKDEECPEGYVKRGNECVCAGGYVKNRSNRCVKKCETTKDDLKKCLKIPITQDYKKLQMQLTNTAKILV